MWRMSSRTRSPRSPARSKPWGASPTRRRRNGCSHHPRGRHKAGSPDQRHIQRLAAGGRALAGAIASRRSGGAAVDPGRHSSLRQRRRGGDAAGGEIPPVEIVLDIAKGIVVRGLESRLGQVFQNLISNAVSFSPDGGKVTVTAVRQGGDAVVTVEDQGPAFLRASWRRSSTASTANARPARRSAPIPASACRSPSRFRRAGRPHPRREPRRPGRRRHRRAVYRAAAAGVIWGRKPSRGAGGLRKIALYLVQLCARRFK